MTFPRLRISLATLMIIVITAAAASALFSRLVRHMPAGSAPASIRYDVATLVVMAVVLTGMAIAARKGHSPRLAMFQITVACLGYLGLLSLAEISTGRPIFYWYQATFAALVVVPLIARRLVKRRIEKGPRRTLWMKRCESVAFAFLNMVLVLIGVGVQLIIVVVVTNVLKF